MTEKRFSISSSYLGLYTVFDDENGCPLSDYELLDLLNELNDKNKELKSLCKALITHIEKKSIAFVIDKDIRRLLE